MIRQSYQASIPTLFLYLLCCTGKIKNPFSLTYILLTKPEGQMKKLLMKKIIQWKKNQ
jgi:hypothetical protein